MPLWPRNARAIVHLDADAFFASVEQALDPRLKGKPIAVGGGHRGIVASASYEARARGIKTAMPTAQALRLCPELQFITGEYGLYSLYSARLFALCSELTPMVEASSIDEGYLDLSGRVRAGADPEKLLRELVARAWEELDLPISVGLATGKTTAAIASKLNKPAGFTVVAPGTEAAFLAPLPTAKMPGLGPAAQAKLGMQGIHTLGELARCTLSYLETVFGCFGREMLGRAAGLDPRPVVAERPPPKSYGHQHTFERDSADRTFLEQQMKAMVDRLLPALRADAVQARRFSLTLRFSDFTSNTVALTLEEPSAREETFYPLIAPLMQRAWTKPLPVRLVGVCFSDLGGNASQLDLFDPERERRGELARAVDALNHTHGKQVVRRATHLAEGEAFTDATVRRPTCALRPPDRMSAYVEKHNRPPARKKGFTLSPGNSRESPLPDEDKSGHGFFP